MHLAGIVLCGGHSSRMGYPKALLPFGPELMLPRIVRLLGEVVPITVVVAASQQSLPILPSDVNVVEDRRDDCGPLEGLRTGLSALPSEVEAAYVTSCDVPLLVPTFVTRMFELLGDQSIAVPKCDGRSHPLSSVYRASLLPQIESLLAAGQFRLSGLFELAATRYVQEAELREFDPQLLSLLNLNHPDDYLAALKHASFAAEPELMRKLTARLQTE